MAPSHQTPSQVPKAGAAFDGLRAGFLESRHRFPNRSALEVDGQTLTFEALHEQAAHLAAALQRHAPKSDVRLTAVLAARSVTAFAGVLAALYRGHGYVPLNPLFPTDRSRAMLVRSGARSLVVDRRGTQRLDEVLTGVPEPLLIVMPDATDIEEWQTRWPQHQFKSAAEAVDCASVYEPVEPADVAYLLFTSGSTGVPKGVGVTHGNALALLDTLLSRYGITEHDRFSQTFDFTFDLSVFDMFMAWARGACVCCPSAKTLLSPGQFVRDRRITVWFSVPSVGVYIKRMGLLKPGQFPTLRWSLFCGEPLPSDVARAWAAAAPGSIVENLYGPTELTVACSVHRWDRDGTGAVTDWVPIGHPFDGMRALIVDEALQPVVPGECGELLMTGPQLTPGYWNDPDRTRQAFVVPPAEREVFYRTGDLVRQAAPDAPMTFVGRRDSQVKVNGYRVELGEVEAALRTAGQVDVAVALAWPRTSSGAGGLVGFVEASSVAVDALRTRLLETLPGYMVPRHIYPLDRFPLNANGKVDRQQLVTWLEVEHEQRVG